MNEVNLYKYLTNHVQKPVHKWAHYLGIYEKHLSRFKGESVVMIEIGVEAGGSLAMWKDYLGSGSQIIGIDINPMCKELESDNIEIFIGSQKDPELVNLIFSKYPKVDILIDDGSHKIQDIKASFDLIYHRMHAEGIYIIEDVQAVYDQNITDKNDSCIFSEFFSQAINELNAGYLGGDPSTKLTCTTNSISFYSGMLVFERHPQSKRNSFKAVGMKEGENSILRSVNIPEQMNFKRENI